VRIKWVNHASFILDTGDARILTDPWIVGTAFNNGWELLAPTVATTEDFATVTHIWFSHEHPDHFHPESLKKIAAMINPSAVLILYQDTLDHRVAKYCRKLGFAVRELPNRAAYKLSDRTTIIVGTVPFYDSWIYIRHGDKGILNLNDCVIKDRKALESIRKACGPIDVLCVQFGYANWEGNPEDEGRQKDAAAEKIRRASMHLELLCPKFIILFASFIRFAHVENSYLNKHNTKLRAALAGLSHRRMWSFCALVTNGIASHQLMQRSQSDSTKSWRPLQRDLLSRLKWTCKESMRPQRITRLASETGTAGFCCE
jgi:UDP-MurNAc hydroxylase